ncbi:MAG: nucleotide sugar dehydrogenase, partial [Actinobacteria bacterium]|nr:nucleotide sugar dehydrogenase [Actinomycetota bacterium]
EKGKLKATTDFSTINELDIIFVCVPTPLTQTKEPDLSAIIKSSEAISKHMRKEQLIILESTTYPGTTEEIVLPILEKNGLKIDKDFYLAFSPERVDPGNKKYTIKDTPKVVGGINENSTKIASLFYQQIIEKVIPVSSTQVAEMTKLLENIFRCVNIALVNELMILCDRMDINIWEVIQASATKPFGFMSFYPGPGLGGHCIPIDPFYLSWKAREYDFHTEFIELAGKVNENMPYYVVSKISQALNKHRKSINGSEILILGVAYKKDISDVRESPALKIIELLDKEGADVVYHDQFVDRVEVDGKAYNSISLTEETLRKSDCIVIVTDHTTVDYKAIAEISSCVVDMRNVL